MPRKLFTPAFLLFTVMFLASCGDGDSTASFDVTVVTQMAPYVDNIVPATATAGETVTIYGLGFSVEYTTNIIHVGETTTSATGYDIGDMESITFVVPDDAVIGDGNISVTVGEYTSNANITFSVTE